MRRSLVIAALLATAALPAQANEGVDLSAKARSSAAAGALTLKQAEAPFRAGHDPIPEMLMRAEQETRGPQRGCDANATTLCYDMNDRRIVYRPIRQYMPRFDGLRAENVSLRHDKIIFKYSFR